MQRVSKGNRVDKSDGLIPDPIHPLGSPHPPGTSRPKIPLGFPLLRGGRKVKEGHTKKNTMRVPQKRDTHTSKLVEPSKRESTDLSVTFELEGIIDNIVDEVSEDGLATYRLLVDFLVVDQTTDYSTKTSKVSAVFGTILVLTKFALACFSTLRKSALRKCLSRAA
jgi:hypothetical protein